MTDLFLGIDLGTSGIRCAVVDADCKPVAMTRSTYPDDTADGWWLAVEAGLHALAGEIGADMARIRAVAVDGTSGTMVLVDSTLTPVTPPLMYNSSGFIDEATRIAVHAPAGHITQGQSSALGRMLRLQSFDPDNRATHMSHQADFIAAKLMGHAGNSDENNSLKTGFDLEAGTWPDWFADTGVRMGLLPQVHTVGDVMGRVDDDVAARFGLNTMVQVRAGTTDSIAAFLASGVDQVGEAVSSLGTTLAIKMLSDVRVDDPARGIYSHRLGDKWLVGGASNTGGGVLLSHFNGDELATLSSQIDPEKTSDLDYYPLSKPGERFPVNDPALPPRLTPRPDSDVQFLHGMLEGIARIEQQCYAALSDLGAPDVTVIHTAGGGAQNDVWTAIRARVSGKPIKVAPNAEAAFGVANLCAVRG